MNIKLIDNRAFITWKAALECGIPKGTLDGARNRKSPSWEFIDDPDDGRAVLVGFDKLRDDHKKKIEARFGDPYEYAAKQPIRNLIKWDDQAEQYYLDYRYNNKPLPTEHVKKYTQAASVLNMLKQVTEDKKTLKKLLKLSIQQFYEKVCEIIKEDKIDLPTSYRRLAIAHDSALKKYINDGYKSLVDWRFGNDLAKKITDELSSSTLLEMIAHPNQYDDVFIAMQYNKWAKQNGYKPIKAATVGVWRREKEEEIIMEREGNAALRNTYLKQAKGVRPSAPLYMIESDDNTLDLLFINPEDNSTSKYYNRYIAVVVTDSFNDMPLGYAYAQNLTTELIRAAYLNAMYYIRSLTGAWYLPHETKTDNWDIKNLKPFYESIGKYIESPAGSKNRGYIEQFFGSPHWKRCIKIGANNYNGNNMTAKFRGVNTEALARNKKDYPLIGAEASQQIEGFFHRLRHMPQSNGVSKQQQWLDAWNQLPAQDKRLINDEQFLLKFGIEHRNESRVLRITNRGVEPQINGVRYSYDLQVPSLMEYVGKPVSILYDPFDMSRVLVTDFDKVRVIATDARLSQRALQDTTTDSRIYLNAVLKEKETDVDYIANKADRRKEVLQAAGIDAEAILQAGVVVKELRQTAEQKVLAPVIERRSFNADDLYDQM
jgi:hypothetical protein